MRPMTRLSALFLLLAFSPATAQTAPAPVDLAKLLKDLAAESSHAGALDRLHAIPLSAVVPLLTAAAAPGVPAAVKDDVNQSLPAIFVRLRAENQKADTDRDKAWRQKYLVTPYKTSGKTGPAWDAAAIAALEYPKADGKSFDLLAAAITAGCPDPLVRQLHLIRGIQLGRIPFPEDTKTFTDTLFECRKSTLPDPTKFFVCIEYLRFMVHFSDSSFTGNVAESHSLLSFLAPLFAPYANSSPAHDVLQENANQFYRCSKEIGGNLAIAANTVLPLIQKSLPGSDIAFHRAAVLEIDTAWEARGGGYASSVTPEGSQTFEAQLALAEKDATRAWSINPLCVGACDDMLSVCTGSGYDRDTMELWFGLAMLASPDDLEACLKKANYLFPKWHGSLPEVYQFARECVETGTAENRIPSVLLSVVDEFRTTATDQQAYMRQPAVWKDIKNAYTKLLADKSRLTSSRDTVLADRGRYLRYACECEQWDAFLTLAKEFGPDLDYKKFGGKDLYSYYQKKAAAEAAKAPGGPRALPETLP